MNPRARRLRRQRRLDKRGTRVFFIRYGIKIVCIACKVFAFPNYASMPPPKTKYEKVVFFERCTVGS